MSKFCKNCKKLNPNPLNKYCSQECLNLKWGYVLKSKTKIRNKSEKNNNTPAKFLIETKWKIKERDSSCILCGTEWSQYHHVYFWANANRKENRNDADQWVLLCEWCHYEIHHWIQWRWKEYRAKCIVYLQELKK